MQERRSPHLPAEIVGIILTYAFHSSYAIDGGDAADDQLLFFTESIINTCATVGRLLRLNRSYARLMLDVGRQPLAKSCVRVGETFLMELAFGDKKHEARARDACVRLYKYMRRFERLLNHVEVMTGGSYCSSLARQEYV